jgi:hypothetical protein
VLDGNRDEETWVGEWVGSGHTYSPFFESKVHVGRRLLVGLGVALVVARINNILSPQVRCDCM